MKKLLHFLILSLFLFSLSGCLIESEEESDGDDFKLTCRIDGEKRTFYAGGFGLDEYDNTYNNFYENKDNDEEYFSMQFPGSVTAGVYDQDSADFSIGYYDESGESYSSIYSGSTLTLTITEWGVEDGDSIEGTFSGNFCGPSGCKAITEGTFESELVVNKK